jgi:hypothetical protein
MKFKHSIFSFLLFCLALIVIPTFIGNLIFRDYKVRGIGSANQIGFDAKSNVSCDFPDSSLTLENVFIEIYSSEMKHPEIVLRQSMHECKQHGVYYNSHNCLKRNNLFGMKGGTKTDSTGSNPQGYKIFNSWQESVADYKEWQDRNYKGGNDNKEEYYQFLIDIGYAEDPHKYVKNLKRIPLIIFDSCKLMK